MKLCCILFVFFVTSFAKPTFKREVNNVDYYVNDAENVNDDETIRDDKQPEATEIDQLETTKEPEFNEETDNEVTEVDIKSETTENQKLETTEQTEVIDDNVEVTEVDTKSDTTEEEQLETTEKSETIKVNSEESTQPEATEEERMETTVESETTEEETETEEVTKTSEKSTTEAVTQSLTTVEEEDETVDENEVGETFLRRMKEEYSKVIDPFPIPDRDFKIEQNIIVATLKFQYKLHNCKLRGLANLFQKEKLEVREKSNRDIRLLTGKLGVDELKASCDVYIQVLAIKTTSKLHGFASDLVVDVEIEHNKKTGRLNLLQFKVEDVNELYFSLDEGGILRSVTNLIVKNVSSFFKGFMTTLFNIEIAYIARSIVSHIIIQE